MVICKRMNGDMIRFLTELLGAALAVKNKPLFSPDLFRTYKNVLVQDASHFSLPGTLADHFLGSHSRMGNAATAKMQEVLIPFGSSLTQGTMVDLHLGSIFLRSWFGCEDAGPLLVGQVVWRGIICVLGSSMAPTG